MHLPPCIYACRLGIYGFTLASCERVTLGTYSKPEEILCQDKRFLLSKNMKPF